MFRSEGGCNAGVSEFDLVICYHTALASIFAHAFLGHLSNELHLFGDGDAHIITEVLYFFVELGLFFLLLFFLFDHLAYVGCSDHCHPHICVPEASHIVGAVSRIDDSSLVVPKVLNDDLLIMGRGPCEDGYEGEIVVREIFGSGSGYNGLGVQFGLVIQILQAGDLVSSPILKLEDVLGALPLEHEDSFPQLQVETNFGSGEAVVSGDDEEIVLSFLQVEDVLGGVFFEGGTADEKPTKLEVFFTELPLLVFVVNLFVVHVVDFL